MGVLGFTYTDDGSYIFTNTCLNRDLSPFFASLFIFWFIFIKQCIKQCIGLNICNENNVSHVIHLSHFIHLINISNINWYHVLIAINLNYYSDKYRLICIVVFKFQLYRNDANKETPTMNSYNDDMSKS